jgi:hypothetical protein
MRPVVNVYIDSTDWFEFRAVKELARWHPDGPLGSDPRRSSITSVLDRDVLTYAQIERTLEYLVELREHYVQREVEAGALAAQGGRAALLVAETSVEAIQAIDEGVAVFRAALIMATKKPPTRCES